MIDQSKGQKIDNKALGLTMICIFFTAVIWTSAPYVLFEWIADMCAKFDLKFVEKCIFKQHEFLHKFSLYSQKTAIERMRLNLAVSALPFEIIIGLIILFYKKTDNAKKKLEANSFEVCFGGSSRKGF